jgi:hypothetical protein
MMHRLLAGAEIVAILSIVVACGGSSSSSTTPSQTSASTTAAAVPTTPPATEAAACQTNQLYGALVSEAAATEPRVLTLGIGNTLGACTLAGPPQIHWYDEAGASIDESVPIPATTSAPCKAGETAFTTCVDTDPITLPSDGTLPAANVDGPMIVVVSIFEIGACADTPIGSAHFIGLTFPNSQFDVQIELSQDIRLSCASQVALQGYGPSK